jgi:electron transport complex protein RnfD
LPLGIAFLGSVVAILVGKQLFGGLGQNIFNPALVGRAFLMASFPTLLTSWTKPYSLDAVTSASPLALWKFSHIFTKLPMATSLEDYEALLPWALTDEQIVVS